MCCLFHAGITLAELYELDETDVLLEFADGDEAADEDAAFHFG